MKGFKFELKTVPLVACFSVFKIVFHFSPCTYMYICNFYIVKFVEPSPFKLVCGNIESYAMLNCILEKIPGPRCLKLS